MELNVSTKEAIIGLRRKNQARTKIGKLLYSMYRQKKNDIAGVKAVCSLLSMDPRVLKKHIGFRFFPQGGKENYILSLSTDDLEVIKKTEEIYQQLKRVDPERQKIAQYIFLHLAKNG